MSSAILANTIELDDFSGGSQANALSAQAGTGNISSKSGLDPSRVFGGTREVDETVSGTPTTGGTGTVAFSISQPGNNPNLAGSAVLTSGQNNALYQFDYFGAGASGNLDLGSQYSPELEVTLSSSASSSATFHVELGGYTNMGYSAGGTIAAGNYTTGTTGTLTLPIAPQGFFAGNIDDIDGFILAISSPTVDGYGADSIANANFTITDARIILAPEPGSLSLIAASALMLRRRKRAEPLR